MLKLTDSKLLFALIVLKKTRSQRLTPAKVKDSPGVGWVAAVVVVVVVSFHPAGAFFFIDSILFGKAARR